MDESGLQSIRVEAFQSACQRAGIRLTPQRLEVFREVASSTAHPDAEAVYRRVRVRVTSISLDTVYRTLWMLTEQGFLQTLGPRRENVRFDANLDPHHHFYCTGCEEVLDLHLPLVDEAVVARAVRAVGSLQSTRVEVRGLCTKCSARQVSG
jgi:Fur family peroxide stress response transcriptional regulator